MEKKNNLSNNLKMYQRLRNKTMSEFSEELSIPRATLRSILSSGNTTLYTAIQIASALHVSLDELVFGDSGRETFSRIQGLLNQMSWYDTLPPEKQASALYHITELLKLLIDEG